MKRGFHGFFSWNSHEIYYLSQTGLLDLDLCGPSCAQMLGVEGQPLVNSQYGWVPPESSPHKVEKRSRRAGRAVSERCIFFFFEKALTLSSTLPLFFPLCAEDQGCVGCRAS